jgi:protein SCO1/2
MRIAKTLARVSRELADGQMRNGSWLRSALSFRLTTARVSRRPVDIRKAAVLLLATLATISMEACETHRKLEGFQRARPLDVSRIRLPEVKAGAAHEPFIMKAKPGELLFVYFGYTSCPDLCPTTLANFRQALKRLGADGVHIDAAFVTVDPKRDSAKVLVPYLSSFLSRVHALRTEDPQTLREAESAFLASSSITPRSNGTYEVGHTPYSYIVDSTGRVIDEWSFGITPAAMASDLRILLHQRPRESTP